jgi:hypothetical protein
MMANSRDDIPPGGNDPHDETGDEEFKRVIRRFARAHRALISRDPEPLPEFIAFRNAVLDAIESTAMVDETSLALALLHRDAQTTEAAHLLVMELEAFSAAAERGQPATAPPEPAHRPWWKRALGIGKTATDSLAEILEKHLPPGAKAIWKVLSELLDIILGE